MDLIFEQYTPEEYASCWGSDPCYCKLPQLPSDGYVLYNFSSENQERTKEYLTDLLGAVTRLIEMVTLRPAYLELESSEKDEDLDGLNQLKTHVEKLLAGVSNE
jgi:hypothetical protein